MIRGTAFTHSFGRATSFALTQDHIFIGTRETFEISVLDREGSLVRIIRGPSEDSPISNELIDAYRQLEPSEVDDELRKALEETGFPMPDAAPAFTEIQTDSEGTLWAKRYSGPGTFENRWAVFAPTGELLGHLDLPQSFVVSDVGPDWIVGISTDELGVDRVEVYGLEKG